MAKEYVKPSLVRIERTNRTERLYTQEGKRNDLLIDAAREWLKVQEKPEDALWNEAIPQALYDLLESFDPQASELAAQAYLESIGYTVSKE